METLSFDFVVVGGGTAGGIVASRLSEETSASICLIEAGPDYTVDEALPEELLRSYGRAFKSLPIETHDWKTTANTGFQRQIHIPRGKVVGGSSAVNGQIFLRGDPDDYDGWARAGLKEWTFENTLPYFIRSERDHDFDGPYHGNHGPIDVRRYSAEQWSHDQRAFFESARALGYKECSDHNAPETTGVGACPLNDDDNGCRASTARAYLALARQRENLTILSGTLVERLLVSGTRVLGVTTRDSVGREVKIVASQIIVCAGAIGTPHLLLRSGIGPADQLKRIGIKPVVDLAGVGAGLQDHPTVEVHLPSAQPTKLSSTHPHQVVMRYQASIPAAPNDMILYGLMRHDLEAFVFRPTLNVAASRGSVTIVSENPYIHPQVDLNYFAEESDLDRQREAIDLCFELASTSQFRAIVQNPTLSPLFALRRDAPALNQWIRLNSATGYHLTSTCRMGRPDDPFAVVDSNGRLYGLEALRIIDASAMPTNVRANTNATVVMMAEYITAMMTRVTMDNKA